MKAPTSSGCCAAYSLPNFLSITSTASPRYNSIVIRACRINVSGSTRCARLSTCDLLQLGKATVLLVQQVRQPITRVEARSAGPHPACYIDCERRFDHQLAGAFTNAAKANRSTVSPHDSRRRRTKEVGR